MSALLIQLAINFAFAFAGHIITKRSMGGGAAQPQIPVMPTPAPVVPAAPSGPLGLGIGNGQFLSSHPVINALLQAGEQISQQALQSWLMNGQIPPGVIPGLSPMQPAQMGPMAAVHAPGATVNVHPQPAPAVAPVAA